MLLTLTETAERLRMSARTVQRLVQTGALPCVRIGRAVRIDPADPATMLEAVKARSAVVPKEKPAC